MREFLFGLRKNAIFLKKFGHQTTSKPTLSCSSMLFTYKTAKKTEKFPIPKLAKWHFLKKPLILTISDHFDHQMFGISARNPLFRAPRRNLTLEPTHIHPNTICWATYGPLGRICRMLGWHWGDIWAQFENYFMSNLQM